MVLSGRQGACTPTQQASVNQLLAMGVDVQIAKVDVADEAAMPQLFDQLLASTSPLRGVVHTAGTLADGIALRQTWDPFETVMAGIRPDRPQEVIFFVRRGPRTLFIPIRTDW